MNIYRTILADPPWRQTLMGKRRRARDPHIAQALPYSTMSLESIKSLPVGDLAAIDCHLWLWTTNEFLRAGFEVLEAWGFKYLAPIHWIKPSGCGNYFIHRTQTMLFGYKGKCLFPRARYVPNVIFANEGEHSQKPKESYELIESVSAEPRLELFARPVTPMFPKIAGWDVWGNEVESDLVLTKGEATAIKGAPLT
jgi:N6-adenosine-specific RNA methylase IME4